MSFICLIAEADPFLASLLLRFAEECGVTSARARTGEEVLALVHKNKPSVLIVDPELPGEQRGWEAVRTMRSTGALGAMRIISCSWLERTEARALIGDVAWHLQKPDLQYTDFINALAAAGVAAEGGV
jgi:CheY-like chemotaxis protein